MRWLLVLGLWLSLGLSALPVGAQSRDIAQAKEYFRAGAAAYAAGDYLAAIQALEAAHRLTPLPAIGFSLAQAERRQYFVSHERPHLERAIELYRSYLQQVATGGRRADAADALSQLEPLLVSLTGAAGAGEAAPAVAAPIRTRVMVSSPTPGASISLDGSAGVPSPMIAEVSPGKHQVRVTAEGFFTGDQRLVAVKGELVPMDVSLRERPATVVVKASSEADLYVDGAYVGPAKGTDQIQLSSGPHTFALARKGHRLEVIEIELSRGQTRTINAELRWTGQRWAAMGLFVGSGLSLVGGAALGSLAVHQEERATEILDRREEGNITAEDRENYSDATRSRDNLRIAAAVNLAASAGALITGLFLYEFDDPNLKKIMPKRGPDAGSAKVHVALGGSLDQPVLNLGLDF